jgi:ABC-type transport system involved in multi-copper enzyme maturation permease subunit
MFLKTLRDVRGMTIAIALFALAIAAMDLLIYPSYQESLQDFELPTAMEGLLGEAGDISSPEGFLTGEFFSWMPLVLMILAIAGGTGAFAGEEGAETMDLLLSQPIRRWELALAKAAALAIAVTISALAAMPGFAVGKVSVNFDIGLGRLAAAVVYMIPGTLLVLGLSLLASATLPNRSIAAMAVTAFVLISYVIQLLADAAPVLETVRKASIFNWAEPSRVVVNGFDWTRALALLVLAVAATALAIWQFERRDIMSGTREWRLRDLRSVIAFRHPESAKRPAGVSEPG